MPVTHCGLAVICKTSGCAGAQHYSNFMQCAAVQELLAKCHPLGMFDAIATLAVASNMRELYRLVLVRLSRGTPAHLP
jgi:hypothetical protein